MNWQREVHVFYRRASSAELAARTAFLALSKKLGMRSMSRVANYFLAGNDNIRVEEIKKDVELYRKGKEA